jgi:hypothetical protein
MKAYVLREESYVVAPAKGDKAGKEAAHVL